MKVMRTLGRILLITLTVMMVGFSVFREKISLASCCSDYQCKSVSTGYYVVTYLWPKDGDCGTTCDSRFYTWESAMLPHVYRLVEPGEGYCTAVAGQGSAHGAYQPGFWNWLGNCVGGNKVEGYRGKCSGTDCGHTC